MTRTRPSASLAIVTAVVGCALPLISTTPIAHADDPLAQIREAVNGERAETTCGPLNYSSALEGEAQAAVGNDLPGVPPAGNYKGYFQTFFGGGDPERTAIYGAEGSAYAALRDCRFKDFGVGFYRIDQSETDRVAITLGQPAAAAPAAPPPFNAATVPVLPPPPHNAATVPALPPPPPALVTNAITLSFGPPHLGSITATVTNSSDLTAKCTYDASGITKTHRDFTVGPHASTDLTFKGLNTATSYHVVVSCHDASGKQTQEIGHAETDVTF